MNPSSLSMMKNNKLEKLKMIVILALAIKIVLILLKCLTWRKTKWKGWFQIKIISNYWNKYEEYENISVNIQEEQKELTFEIPFKDLEKAKDTKIDYIHERDPYSLSILVNPDNPSSFDIMLSRVIDTSELGFEPQIFKSNAIIIPKVSMELSDESNIVITNLQSRITFKEPVANIAKLLVLSDASLKSDLEIKW